MQNENDMMINEIICGLDERKKKIYTFVRNYATKTFTARLVVSICDSTVMEFVINIFLGCTICASETTHFLMTFQLSLTDIRKKKWKKKINKEIDIPKKIVLS